MSLQSEGCYEQDLQGQQLETELNVSWLNVYCSCGPLLFISEQKTMETLHPCFVETKPQLYNGSLLQRNVAQWYKLKFALFLKTIISGNKWTQTTIITISFNSCIIGFEIDWTFPHFA